MECSPAVIIYKKKKYYAIWKTDSADEFETKERKVILFESVDEAADYLSNKKMRFRSSEITTYDLDWFIENCICSEYGDCKAILLYWNMFSDMAKSVKTKFLGDDEKNNKIYDKLFFGNNLPTVTPDGKHYEPIWSNAERKSITAILSEGVEIVKSQLE